MLDFNPAREGKISWTDLTHGQSVRTFHALVDEIIDAQLDIIRDAQDRDVIFQPIDPNAKELFDTAKADANAAWTLGHVILHATASSEEAAAIALDLARGVAATWRSRYEPAWEPVTTIAQCRQRLEESRRMRHGMLAAWPDSPSSLTWQHYYFKDIYVDCFGRFLMGLSHEEGHLNQLREIMRQAKAARADAEAKAKAAQV